MSSGFVQRAFTPWKGGLQGAVSAIDPAYQLTGKTILNPVSFAGKNSFLAKESEYDPLLGSSGGKYINPEAYNVGQQRKAYYAANTGAAGPTAGAAPSLALASGAYQGNNTGASATAPAPTVTPAAKTAAAPQGATTTTGTPAAAATAAAGAYGQTMQPSVWTQALRQNALNGQNGQNSQQLNQFGGAY